MYDKYCTSTSTWSWFTNFSTPTKEVQYDNAYKSYGSRPCKTPGLLGLSTKVVVYDCRTRTVQKYSLYVETFGFIWRRQYPARFTVNTTWLLSRVFDMAVEFTLFKHTQALSVVWWQKDEKSNFFVRCVMDNQNEEETKFCIIYIAPTTFKLT